MTAAEQDTPVIPDNVVEIEADDAPETTDTVGDRIPFTMPGQDDVVLWAVRPKNMLLMLTGQRVEEAAASGDFADKMNAYRTFLDAAVDPESRDVIWVRLGDPTDDLDDRHMDALIATFLGRWFARPTGSQRASATLPRTTGRPSTGRSRSKGKTRKN